MQTCAILSLLHFLQLQVDKRALSYIKFSTMKKSEQIIAKYLVSVACEACGEIINNNDCLELQTKSFGII